MSVSVADPPGALFLAERRFADYEAYSRYEQNRVIDDELTELSERLNDVMLNTFEYDFGDDGELYYNGESLEPIFRRGMQKAEIVASEHPQFTVELLRRGIEYNQYLAQKAIGRQSDENELILVHISPTPDSVLQGVDLGAYDVGRKKIMVRVTEKTDSGIRVSSMSLDSGNRLGIQSIGDMCGTSVADDATSEEILATNFYLSKNDLQDREPTQVIRQRYDNAMKMQFGGEWYAGRRDGIDGVHTLQFIVDQTEDIRVYTDSVLSLKERIGQGFRSSEQYKKLNYDFLSLLNRRKENPGYTGSAEQAGAEDRTQGVEHEKSDCPTGDNLNQQSTQSMLDKLGFGEKRMMSCPFCRSSVYGDPCSLDQFCPQCEAKVVGGKLVSKGLGRKGVEAKRLDLLRNNAKKKPADGVDRALRRRLMDRAIRLKYGSAAMYREVVSLGTAERKVVNVITNEIYE